MFKTLSLTACAAAVLLTASGAMAAPADDAKTHFQAIGSGDLSIVMRGYADQAQFNWVGGPLDGTYANADAIRGVWEKFTKSQGPLKVSVDSLGADTFHLVTVSTSWKSPPIQKVPPFRPTCSSKARHPSRFATC